METFVFMFCTIPMTQKAMADVMYAVIMTGATVESTTGVGPTDIYQQSREENLFNQVHVMVEIPQDEVVLFEQFSGTALHFPPAPSIK